MYGRHVNTITVDKTYVVSINIITLIPTATFYHTYIHTVANNKCEPQWSEWDE